MRRTVITMGGVTLLAMGSISAWAGNLTVPNDFVAGTKAVAADVNANFDAVETAVNDNDTRITANTADIATNATAIGTRAAATDVTANTAAIATNTADIATNAGDIATNTADIATNAGNITNNANSIATNTADIATNAGNITTNTTNIATNTANITSLQQNGNKTGTACAGNDANDIMVRVGPLCVDRYEASVWTTADGSASGAQFGTSGDDYDTGTVGGVVCSNNGNNCTGVNTIYARSEAGVTPSTDITWYQAQQACAASGKRLLTNAEWQMAAAGTPDPGATDNGTDECRVSTGKGTTGSRSQCISNWGVNDMAGNNWEWVADWIHGDGTAGNNWAPASGSAGADYGSDIISGANPAQTQGTNASNQPAAIFRGGRNGAGANAGIFALAASNSPAYSDADVGFRCAR